jgi:hypothetical protein
MNCSENMCVAHHHQDSEVSEHTCCRCGSSSLHAASNSRCCCCCCCRDQWNFTLLPTSRSQDPTGAYIKRWVPELAGLPPAHIHTPWTAPAADLEAAGVVLGHNYPHR